MLTNLVSFLYGMLETLKRDKSIWFRLLDVYSIIRVLFIYYN